ncbi:MAG: UBP-type zinc finger domain-containing protein [Pseudonocardia sp.]
MSPNTAGDPDGATCAHLDQIRDLGPGTSEGCEDCLREGSSWVHLRRCLSCGHLGCCDSSPRRHAAAHWHTDGHPLVRSAEPGEDWAWCYPDELMLAPA